MYNEKMYKLGSKRSVIRELFEYGKKRAAEMGKDSVFDYSLGNPNVPAPKEINETIIELLNELDSIEVHGYTSAPGNLSTRQIISKNIKDRFNCDIPANNIYITSGAAAALTITLNALSTNESDFITFAPFFPEYKVFTGAARARLKIVPFNENTFMPDLNAFEKVIGPKTKGVIINSPNNPSGVVYDEETIKKIVDIIKKANERFETNIVIISDEPYRELVYDNTFVPYLPNYYDNTIVCYSYSKSLSLPGERIGYIAVSPKLHMADAIVLAVAGAGRSLGYVCASSLFQRVIEKCIDVQVDINAYKKNRDLIYNSLTKIGYQCIKPQGAFYLFVKSLEEDATAFSDKAKTLGLLIVPGDDFGAPGFVRLAYCVSYDMIERSIKAFQKLYEMYQQ